MLQMYVKYAACHFFIMKESSLTRTFTVRNILHIHSSSLEITDMGNFIFKYRYLPKTFYPKYQQLQ